MSGPADVEALQALQALQARWAAQWPQALARWGRYVRLSSPIWCRDEASRQAQGLGDGFAAIRLVDQRVVIGLDLIAERGLGDHGLAILAHEIGHHVLIPGSMLAQGRLLARIRHGLPGSEEAAPMVANLYADLLINDRLTRTSELDLAAIYRLLRAKQEGGSWLWALYQRIYEILWGLLRGSLAPMEGLSTELGENKALDPAARKALEAFSGADLFDAFEGDARLGADLIRVYRRNWMEGAGRFAVLVLPWLLRDKANAPEPLRLPWFDLEKAGAGAKRPPPGLSQRGAGEAEGAVHPLSDPLLGGTPEEADEAGEGGGAGQARMPLEYADLLRQLGMVVDDEDVAIAYYRERAVPHLIRYPEQILPLAADPLPEGQAVWELGADPDRIDWLATVMASPTIVPGVTTREPIWGRTEGHAPERKPVDLDLYIDCSGSMPNPRRVLSWPTLAGAVLLLSALRAGARARVCLWSGPGSVLLSEKDFTRDERVLMATLTRYMGGGTCFPLHVLRQTWLETTRERPTHLLVVSDSGIDTMLQQDEQGRDGAEIVREALAAAGGGGTLALNTAYGRTRREPELVELGWQIHPVSDEEGLLAFARDFSRRTWGQITRSHSGGSARR